MAKKKQLASSALRVDTITHKTDRRTSIPTLDVEPILPDDVKRRVPVDYEKRNADLDPQLLWRGKFDGDETLTVNASPLYVQEKIHPRVLLDAFIKECKAREQDAEDLALVYSSDFNGVPEGVDKMDFYKHDQNWTNRMILGDSLQVMASLAEREELRGKVQCIYMDPPYGIKFSSNFQVATNATAKKDCTREPEMIKAFRDTWKDGIHSYLDYLRDRFILARTLLSESGSIFVQIGDENVHRVRALLDEIFGPENFETQIAYATTSGNVRGENTGLARATNYLLWFCKNKELRKYRPLFQDKNFGEEGASAYNKIELGDGERISKSDFEKRFGEKFDYDRRADFDARCRVYMRDNATSEGAASEDQTFVFQGKTFSPGSKHWKPGLQGMEVLAKAGRLAGTEKSVSYIRYLEDFPASSFNNVWPDTSRGFASDKIYVVQTGTEIVKRCLLMSTDPGDLVLDPTCGSGTTAFVAEQWGRRWITIDTSRVAIALARTRLMRAVFPWYLLKDSAEGRRKDAELSGDYSPASVPSNGNIKLGFVCERIPHVQLSDIANNKEIPEIWEKFQKTLEPLRQKLNATLSKNWEEWEIPRKAEKTWSAEAKAFHKDWWEQWKLRRAEINASIERKSNFEVRFDKPLENKGVVRVAGPFTVESVSPYRVLGIDADGNTLDPAEKIRDEVSADFAQMILENLKKHGIQQQNKDDRIELVDFRENAGDYICAVAGYDKGEKRRKAGIFIGPEFGTVGRQDLLAASKEAAELGCNDLVCCAFNYDAVATDLSGFGKVNIIKAKINPELHMGDKLKGTGNLFVVFGEPDIKIEPCADDAEKIVVKILGVDLFLPQEDKIRSCGTDRIACWFLDTEYDDESFFVRHAYFCGGDSRKDYESLKRSLISEIDEDAWRALYGTESRPFRKPKSGKIAVKVINVYGDEVMKIIKV